MAVVVESSTSAKQRDDNKLTITRPAGVAAGDRLVAIISPGDVVTTAPTGWTLADSASGTIDAGIYEKVATTSEPTSYQWLWTGNHDKVGIILRLSGASALSTSAFQGESTTSDPTSITAPTITTATDNALVLACYFTSDPTANAITYTPAGGTTEQAEQAGGSDNQMGLMVATYTQASAGATGTKVATISGTTGTVTTQAYQVEVPSDNSVPNTPTLTHPIGSAVKDLDDDIILQFTHDDDDGDAQVDAEVRYRDVGNATWTTVTSLGTAVSYTISGGTLAADDWEWQARTSDDEGFGSWSSSAYFTTADRPAAPVITAPADAATVTVAEYALTHTHADSPVSMQIVVTSTDDATTHYDSGPIAWATSHTDDLFPAAANASDVKVKSRVKKDGLWSAYDSHTVTVSYAGPLTPGLTVTAATAWVTLTVDSPTGGQTVNNFEIHRQQSLDSGTTWTDFARTTDAYDRTHSELGDDAVVTDYAVADGVDYRWRVRANGDNGVSTDSAWAESGTIAAETGDYGLRWSPPFDVATASYTLVELAAGQDIDDVTTMTTGNDYVVVPAAGNTAHLEEIDVSGGRHVIIRGFNFEPNTASQNCIQVLDGDSGRIVHIEGCTASNPSAIESDFIQLGSGTTIVQIQWCHIDGLLGSSAGTHADVMQLTAGAQELRVHRVTGRSDYNTLYMRRNADAAAVQGVLTFSRTNMIAEDGGDGGANNPRVLSVGTQSNTTNNPDTGNNYHRGHLDADIVLDKFGGIRVDNDMGEIVWPDDSGVLDNSETLAASTTNTASGDLSADFPLGWAGWDDYAPGRSLTANQLLEIGDGLVRDSESAQGKVGIGPPPKGDWCPDEIHASYTDPENVSSAPSDATILSYDFAGGTDTSTIDTTTTTHGDDALDAVNGTPTFSATQALDRRTLSMESVSDEFAGWDATSMPTASLQNGDTFWARFYVYMSAAPASTARLMRVRDENDDLIAAVRVLSSGLIQAQSNNGGGTSTANSAVAVATGRWVRVEVEIDLGTSSDGGMRLRYYDAATKKADLTEELTISSVTSLSGTQADEIQFGLTNTVSAFTVYTARVGVSTLGWMGM